ncbi:flagellar filament capping protein FliD [Shewanella violacea]|uniref:Flagellar hook-associated protein 2 n=1 Tax=Shewanella violacea (strain JCM 10179 / CIP 106290 / LMG 19151 / DSS12) TaxID=637905 RepID=D4ZI97_SHEVD|nr:flagellar filament capping protein FliD [Shewanella violacea]BAJ01396.1 flagellar hook-associated protein FliD [Shewanella violacea DSS12]
MGLTAVGIGSGMDINGIVSALVGAENTPKQAQFNADEGKINAEISAIGALKSAMSEFQSKLDFLSKPESFISNKVKLSNNDFLTATVDETAIAGSYSLVVEQLAQSQKVSSIASADASAAIGEGTLTFTVDGNSFDIAADATDSLTSLVEKINSAADNVGVSATIINDDQGAKLVLTSTSTGIANQISVAATDVGPGTPLSDTFTMTEVQTAKDSIIKLDGLTVTSSSNTISNAITGATLTLKEADPTKTTQLTIELNTGSVKAGINALVSSYNDLMTSVKEMSSYDPDTKQAGILQGDSIIRTIQSQLRGALTGVYSTSDGDITLGTIGITTTREGLLEVDSDKLDEALTANFGQIKEMFSAENTGLASSLDSLIDGYVKSDGILDGRDETLDNQLERIQENRERLALKMKAYENRLFKQFNAMDAIVGQLNAQSSMLQSRLDSLPGVVKKT